MNKELELFLTKFGGSAWKIATLDQMRDDLLTALNSDKMYGPERFLANALKRKLAKVSSKEDLLNTVTNALLGED